MTEKKKDDLEAVREVSEILQGFTAEEAQRIVRWAFERLGISVQQESKSGQRLGELAQTKSIKDFYSEKKPSSDNQFAVLVAYYYQFDAPESERKMAINSETLQEATRLAGRARLKNPGNTLANCQKLGYLNKTKDRGYFAINTVGENLVAMTMPDQEKSK